MKKVYLFLFTISIALIGFSQTADFAKSIELVQKNKLEIGLNPKINDNFFVSSAYKSNDILYTYINQSYLGLPVYNQMITISSKNGVITSKAGTFISEFEKIAITNSISPKVSAIDATKLAFAEEKLIFNNDGKNYKVEATSFNFGILSNVTEEVKGELIWLPFELKGKYTSAKLVWNITVAPKGSDNIWKIMVDANNGNIIGKQNFTIFDNWDIKNAKNNNAFEENLKYRSISQDIRNVQNPTAVANASYLVVPYPAESPIHTGGTPAIRTNPWTAAVGNASTLGWHSNGTTDYTISRGNNVWATEDQAATNTNSGPAAVSSTTPDLTFNFPPNFVTDPRNAAFQQFAITNLFYWNNITHDIHYQYGFNEAAGNFQANNLSRGGSGGDDVIALAQSGAAGSIGNNANFSTPADGGRPRMRMYLFNAPVVTKVHVNLPASAVADYPAIEENFSTGYDLAVNGSVTGEVVSFTDAAGGLSQACTGPPTNTLTGKIALINRGNCNFTLKVKEAQLAGAIGVIMVNNVAGAPIIMGGTDNTITIPAVMITQPNGLTLAESLPGLNVTISSQAGVPLDGDLDNGVIVHEYGHGISNRLTGGPATTSCLNNAEQGGEGWSDYFGLMLTTDWANTALTAGPNPRPIGNYVTAQSATTGLGIRNYPYSTNLTVNPLTYANMGTGTIGTEVHNIGEIWCAAVWEMTWAIIAQENSINPNLYNFSPTTTGGNSIALKLVLEGLKLQPCSPGYVDGRNAVLAADRNLYNGSHACSIWTAFAKRGLGYGALQGSSNSATDQTPSTVMPPAPTIATQPVDVSVAAGTNATFTANAGTDVNLIYRWEVSTNGGTTWTPVVPAVITPTLTLTGVSSAMNNNKYRCVVFIGCATTNSSIATLTVTGSAPTPPVISNQPIATTVCAGTNATFTAAATGATSYNWQVSTNGGGTWVDVVPANTTTTLTLNAVTVGMSTNQYRMVATNTTGSVNSNAAILTVTAPAAAPTVASPITYCQGATAAVLTATGTNILWYGTNATGGTGSTAAPSPNTTTVGSTTYYVSQTSVTCESPRAAITVTVNATPAAPTVTAVSYCQNATATALTATGTNLLWYGTNATGGTGSATAPTPNTTTVGSTTYYVSQTTGTCEGPRAAITVTITSTPSAPTVTSPVTYCQGVVANQLTATGTNLLWYGTNATGGTGSATSPTPSTTTVGSTTYYVSQTTGCESPRAAITVTIIAGTAAPTVTSPITYCQGVTATALTATGTNLLWYLAATGGTGSAAAPTPSTTTVGSTTYYVSQTSGVCESPRASITVTVNATPAAPTVTTPVTYCQNATATALTATGTNLKWYIVSTGGTALASAPTPSTTTLGSTIYYVSQTTGTCEGPRAAITITIAAQTAAPIVTTPITYCQGSSTSALTATGTNLLWYGTSATGGTGSSTATTPSSATVGSTTYYVSQTGACESPRAAIVVTVVTSPAAPTAASPISYCQGNTATALTATGTNLLWYGTNATGGTGSATATNPSTAAAGSTTYYVSQTLGTCESPRTAITVNVGAAPAITTQPQDITSCATTATFSVVASGSLLTFQWQVSTDGGVTYTNISGATASSITLTGLTAAQSNNKYRVVVSSASCPSATSVAVSAKVGTPPVIVLTAAPVTNFNPRINGGLYTTVSPPSASYVYQWKRNNNIIANTTTSLTKANGLLDEFGTYVVTVTDNTTGCFGVSNAIAVTDIEGERNHMFSSPNPTQGMVNVSFYSDNTNTITRKLIVTDSKGARVLVKEFTTTGRYVNTTVNLTNFAAGNYNITMFDANGKEIASQIVVKY